MNHLAHALLGAADADLTFGSLLADFLRGTVDPALPRGVRIGVALHRAVDRDEAMIAATLDGLSRRLSRANPLAIALPVVRSRAAALDRAFATFFPDLVAQAERERARLMLSIGQAQLGPDAKRQRHLQERLVRRRRHRTRSRACADDGSRTQRQAPPPKRDR